MVVSIVNSLVQTCQFAVKLVRTGVGIVLFHSRVNTGSPSVAVTSEITVWFHYPETAFNLDEDAELIIWRIAVLSIRGGQGSV